MTKYGLDVSTYNGIVDWTKVKASGKEFAIIKIIKKDLSKDDKFETNWTNAKNAGLEIYGVYNYSYANSLERALQEARAVIKALGTRKTIVWMDVEDKVMKGLDSNLIEIIKAYKTIIEESGNKFGIYTGLSFYNTYIKPWVYQLKDVKFWIARYGVNNGKRDVKYQPQIKNMIIWQYSSKGSVSGVIGNVDVNVCYDTSFFTDVIKVSSPTSVKNPYLEPSRLLRYKTINMRGEDVKWVQFELVQKNYMSSSNDRGKTSIDGIFGKVTRDAVIEFQKDKGIEVDGIVGQQTRKYLKG